MAQINPQFQNIILSNQSIDLYQQIKELKEIPEMKNEDNKVKSIIVNHNNISNISNVNIKSLETLECGFNQLVDCQVILSPNLLRLNLQYNKIEQLQLQSRFMQYLNLQNNMIQKVDFLVNLKDLRYLNLGYNLITKVDFLIFNTKLDELLLQGNQIKNLNMAFENTPNIRILNVSNNQLTSIAFMDKLQNLEQLEISCNKLEKLDMTITNENLQILDLSYNQITLISEIEIKFPCLTNLLIQNNFIIGECDMQFLFLMNNIMEIDFRDNPFYNKDFENVLIVQCPWLELVNGREVGKPGSYTRQELQRLIEIEKQKELEQVEQQDQREDQKIQQTQDDQEDNDEITEERLKAILYVENMNEKDDEVEQLMTQRNQKIDESMTQDQFSTFITQSNDDMMKIRQQYLSIMSKKIKTEISQTDNEQKEIVPEPPQTPSKILNPLRKSVIIKSSQPTKKQASILQEISQLKSTMKSKDFQQSLGITQQVSISRLQKNDRQPSQPKMNQSSENFHKQEKQEARSNSIRPKMQSANIKLPKI
ncbi:hypothetical protein pb186bvf_007906 [Paramecium bursaria]